MARGRPRRPGARPRAALQRLLLALAVAAHSAAATLSAYDGCKQSDVRLTFAVLKQNDWFNKECNSDGTKCSDVS